MANLKSEEFGPPSIYELQNLRKLYTQGGAAYSSVVVQNFSTDGKKRQCRF